MFCFPSQVQLTSQWNGQKLNFLDLRENLLKTRMGSQGFCQNAHGNTSD